MEKQEVAICSTSDLWSALQSTGLQSPGYGRAIHSQTIRGDLVLME